MTGLYIALTFALTCLGSISGISGGTVLKPVMDLAGGYAAPQIRVLTGAAVFFMSLVSVMRNLGLKNQFQPASALTLVLGAVAGGFLGQALLARLISAAADDHLVKLCQNIILGSLVLFVLARTFHKNGRRYELRHGVFRLCAGVSLGLLSAFLNIGGGPINMAFLMFLFNMDVKKAAAHSLLIILFAQAANLLSIALREGIGAFDLMPLLPCMAVAAVAGSLLGTALNKRMGQRTVLAVFGFMLAVVLCAVGFNIVKFCK
ncbi:MAG: sulfite exporter TauE/SafE family protein [Kiritimatiellaeota bacterium]|nr:sulfite exporter TauE/SafE family protein [Kiritimatiellota bacterium]